MKVLKIDTRKTYIAEARKFLLSIGEMPKGLYEVIVRKPLRTPRQNNCIHALFPDLAVELNGLGIELRFGNFQASWTETMAKDFFKQVYLVGKKTSKCTTKELSDAVKKLLHDINARGGSLAIKDKFLTELLKNN